MLDYDDHVDDDGDDDDDDNGDGDDGFGDGDAAADDGDNAFDDVDGLPAKNSYDKTPSWWNLSVTIKLDQVYCACLRKGLLCLYILKLCNSNNLSMCFF